ncbi:MAG: prepilin-type N-terminal cleavage/methylation domain-containing protein [Candidatus Binatia bacterium]|nr:prepilin-type N-terminal cleavage/methylation domain-containing protein [Candidatus Binatia bacterium]
MNRGSAGFTLIEVLVAMVIFAIATAATASLMFHSTTYLAQSNERSRAIAIAQQVVEDLRTVDYSEMESGSTTVDWKGQSAFFTVHWNVDTDEPEPGMATVAVSVSWHHKGEMHTYETHTIYTDIDA